MMAKARFFSLIFFIFFLQTVLVSVAAAATRIMPLGDSITQGFASGESLEPRQVSYRKALWDKLIDAGYDVDFVGSLNSGEALFADGDHEGWPGYEADEIRDDVFDWLQHSPADIVLLHIGTNDIGTSQSVAGIVDEVEEILTNIFQYNSEITVILAKIINRQTFNQKTNDFNNLLPIMVNGHPFKDKIIIVDMEVGAGIDYREQPAGDMWNPLHPYQYGAGYDKMADEWFFALEEILPDPDPDPADNSSSSDSGCFIGTAAY